MLAADSHMNIDCVDPLGRFLQDDDDDGGGGEDDSDGDVEDDDRDGGGGEDDGDGDEWTLTELAFRHIGQQASHQKATFISVFSSSEHFIFYMKLPLIVRIDGRSALLMAIDNENLEMVELLLESKVVL